MPASPFELWMVVGLFCVVGPLATWRVRHELRQYAAEAEKTRARQPR